MSNRLSATLHRGVAVREGVTCLSGGSCRNYLVPGWRPCLVGGGSARRHSSRRFSPAQPAPRHGVDFASHVLAVRCGVAPLAAAEYLPSRNAVRRGHATSLIGA